MIFEADAALEILGRHAAIQEAALSALGTDKPDLSGPTSAYVKELLKATSAIEGMPITGWLQGHLAGVAGISRKTKVTFVEDVEKKPYSGYTNHFSVCTAGPTMAKTLIEDQVGAGTLKSVIRSAPVAGSLAPMPSHSLSPSDRALSLHSPSPPRSSFFAHTRVGGLYVRPTWKA